MDATLSSEAPFIVPEARAQYSFPEFTSGRTQNLPALPVSIPSQPRSAQVFPQVDTKAAMPDPGSPGLRTIVFTEAPDPLKLLLDQLEEFRSFGEDDDDDSFHPSTSATMAPFAASSRISGGTRMEDLLGSTPNDRFSPRVEVRPKRRIRRVGANSTSLACYHCRGRKIRCGGSLGAKGTPCRYASIILYFDDRHLTRILQPVREKEHTVQFPRFFAAWTTQQQSNMTAEQLSKAMSIYSLGLIIVVKVHQHIVIA